MSLARVQFQELLFAISISNAYAGRPRDFGQTSLSSNLVDEHVQRAAAAFGTRVATVSEGSCAILRKIADGRSGDLHIMIAGDSVARFTAMAMIEHLHGDNNSFCDWNPLKDGQDDCLGQKKYFDEPKCYPRRSFWCRDQAKASLWSDGSPTPLGATVCQHEAGGVTNIKISGVENFGDVFEDFDPLQKAQIAIEESKPDFLVVHYMRSLLAAANGEQRYRDWVRRWWDMAEKSGIFMIWLAMHKRCLHGPHAIPERYLTTQNNTFVARANKVAAAAANTHNGQFLDAGLSESMSCSDTHDGTHLGYQSNLHKVDALVKTLQKLA